MNERLPFLQQVLRTLLMEEALYWRAWEGLEDVQPKEEAFKNWRRKAKDIRQFSLDVQDLRGRISPSLGSRVNNIDVNKVRKTIEWHHSQRLAIEARHNKMACHFGYRLMCGNI